MPFYKNFQSDQEEKLRLKTEVYRTLQQITDRSKAEGVTTRTSGI